MRNPNGFLVFPTNRNDDRAGIYGKVNNMEINCPVLAASGERESYQVPQTEENPRPQWLLELDMDGTIRHSSPPPSAAADATSVPLVGSNFFDLDPLLGDLSDLKKNFFGFVKSDKNRETANLRTGAVPSGRDAVIVLTRSFDTSWPTRKPVVLMEIRAEQ
jgi:hypothetical protein